jgi:hypothetical protein
MAYKIVGQTVIDDNRNVIIGSLASNPTGVPAGTIYFNTSTNQLYGFNGTAWNPLTAA